jgi:NAD(P)-dependent dehydrogenase (short-subunit alcohol dehydrogenase family)
VIWAPDCLAGKTALVTGASSGLGSHFAQVLANAGAKVLLAARRQQPLSDLAAQIRASGGRCETLLVDLSINSDFSAFVAGLEPIDILVNNAGLVREAAALDARLDDWNAVLDTNLRAMFFLSQQVAIQMRSRGARGSIVNVASILGLRQAGGIASYAVSKAGVIQPRHWRLNSPVSEFASTPWRPVISTLNSTMHSGPKTRAKR